MARNAPAPRGARRKPVKKAGVPLRERIAAAVPWMLVSSVALVMLLAVAVAVTAVAVTAVAVAVVVVCGSRVTGCTVPV